MQSYLVQFLVLLSPESVVGVPEEAGWKSIHPTSMQSYLVQFLVLLSPESVVGGALITEPLHRWSTGGGVENLQLTGDTSGWWCTNCPLAFVLQVVNYCSQQSLEGDRRYVEKVVCVGLVPSFQESLDRT